MAIINYSELKKRIEQLTFLFHTTHSIRKHLEVVFVFGQAGDNTTTSNRAKFLQYVQCEDTPFNFITIESLYDDLKTYSADKKGITAKRTALVELELNAIKQAYSLVIFPESAGSYAELGYFTAIEETKNKIYVANHFSFSTQSSYLNHLIDVVHNERELRPLYMDFHSDNPSSSFKDLLKNLTTDYEENCLTPKFENHTLFPLAIIYELVRLLPYLTYKQLEAATNQIIESYSTYSYDKKNFTVNISMLVVASLIKRVHQEDQIYFVPVDPNYEFMQFNLSERDHVHLMKFHVEYAADAKKVNDD